MVISLLLLLTGVGVIALAIWDAATTALSTTSAGGPLTRRLTRVGWRLAHRVARRPTSPLLAAIGPLLLLTTVVTWLLVVWAGWTLIFSADGDAVVSATTGAPADWSQRIYFAGFTMFTLGIGDVVPTTAPWQLLTVVATVSGFALTTASIAYLLPVVSAATDRSTQAAVIAGLGASSHDVVRTAYHEGSVRFLEPVLVQVTHDLLLTAERHLAYPILHYFHPRARDVELRVQLAVLDDALVLVEHGLAAEVERPHPAAIEGLRRAIAHLLDRADITDAGTAPPLSLDPLRAAGLPVTSDATFDERCAVLAEHRRRVAGYAAESKWQRPDDAPGTDQHPRSEGRRAAS